MRIDRLSRNTPVPPARPLVQAAPEVAAPPPKGDYAAPPPPVGWEARGGPRLALPTPPDPNTFVRAPGATLDPAYYQNAVESQAIFVDFLERRGPKNAENLLAASQQMHRVATWGTNADRPYLGLALDYLRDVYRPGELRVAEPLLRGSGTRPEAIEYTQKVLADLKLGAPLGDGPVPIRGVPVTPDGAANQKGYHLYPLGGEASLLPYFKRAAQLLNELGPPSKKPDPAALEAIGRYYHVLCNARPFEQINNSLVMGQVNLLLARHGFTPVSHGWLDHIAFRTDDRTFAEVFKAHVEGRVKPPSEYGLNIKQ